MLSERKLRSATGGGDGKEGGNGKKVVLMLVGVSRRQLGLTIDPAQRFFGTGYNYYRISILRWKLFAVIYGR